MRIIGMNFVIFLLIFLISDVVINLLTGRVLKILGIDFLFLASWLAGINYGVAQGIIVSAVLLVEHSLLHPSKTQFILFSFPSQIGAVILGHTLGMGGFFVSLVIYQVINSVLMLVTGGFGMFFVVFLIVNSVFNVIVYRILLAVG